MKNDSLIATIPGGFGGGRRGGGGGGAGTPQSTEVKDVKFDGVNVVFAVERAMRDQTMKTEYKATIKDGIMAGTMGMGGRFAREFTGKKKEN